MSNAASEDRTPRDCHKCGRRHPAPLHHTKKNGAQIFACDCPCHEGGPGTVYEGELPDWTPPA